MMQSINNQNIDRKIPLSLSFSNADKYIFECNSIKESENKCLIFSSTENNKEVFELYKKLYPQIHVNECGYEC